VPRAPAADSQGTMQPDAVNMLTPLSAPHTAAWWLCASPSVTPHSWTAFVRVRGLNIPIRHLRPILTPNSSAGLCGAYLREIVTAFDPAACAPPVYSFKVV
jgi:hypothetical protein